MMGGKKHPPSSTQKKPAKRQVWTGAPLLTWSQGLRAAHPRPGHGNAWVLEALGVLEAPRQSGLPRPGEPRAVAREVVMRRAPAHLETT